MVRPRADRHHGAMHSAAPNLISINNARPPTRHPVPRRDDVHSAATGRAAIRPPSGQRILPRHILFRFNIDIMKAIRIIAIGKII